MAEGGDGYVFDVRPADDGQHVEGGRPIFKIMSRRIKIVPSDGDGAVAQLADFALATIVRRYVGTRDPRQLQFVAGSPVDHRVKWLPGTAAGAKGCTVDLAVKMERVVGTSLQEQAAEWRISAREAARTGETCSFCRNVRTWHTIQRLVEFNAHALHAREVIHRDIKPHNIMWASGREHPLVFVDFDSATFAGPTIGGPAMERHGFDVMGS
eukprot:g74.t1